MKKYTGKTIFLGIDVHKKTYSITTIDGEGKRQINPIFLLACG
jgi:hypothetical protein